MYTTPCPNQKLHALADHIPSMLAAWDGNLRCRFANRAYKDWFGADPGGMLGTSIQSLLGPTLFGLNEPYMRGALAGEEQVFERLIVGPDGIGRHSQARYTPEVAEGSVVGFFAEVTDVSHVKAAEFALARRVERLTKRRVLRARPAPGTADQEKLALLSDFQQGVRTELDAMNDHRRGAYLAQLAHELRNALAPIAAGADFVGRAEATPPQAVRKVGAMLSRQVRHMGRLLDDILDLGSMEAGVLPMTPGRVDIKEVVQQALLVSDHAIKEARHALVFQQSEEPLFVDADETRLVQVVSNLLNNAAKYTPPGGRIAVTADKNGPWVEVAVHDDGIGMPPEALSTVFELFHQLPGSEGMRQGGMGVGLALVRQIVRAHGGTVVASSEGRGRGSSFIVRLAAASGSLRNTTD